MLRLFKPYLDKIKNALSNKERKMYADIILINEEGKFLTLLRSKSDAFEPSKWCLPGGTVDHSEDPITAAIRELKEETNLIVDIEDVEFYKKLEKGDCIIYYFIGSYQGGYTIPDIIEHEGFEWIYPDEIKDKDFILELKPFLMDIFKVEGGVALGDKINSALETLNKALDSGEIDADTYLNKINKLNIIKSNYESGGNLEKSLDEGLIADEEYLNLVKSKVYKNILVKNPKGIDFYRKQLVSAKWEKKENSVLMANDAIIRDNTDSYYHELKNKSIRFIEEDIASNTDGVKTPNNHPSDYRGQAERVIESTLNKFSEATDGKINTLLQLTKVCGGILDNSTLISTRFFETDNNLQFSVDTDKYTLNRSFDLENKSIIVNEHFANKSTENLIGTSILNNQTRFASEAGFKSLVCDAIRSPYNNGYYTWLMLGYIPVESQLFDERFSELIKNTKFSESDSYLDLLSSKEGRQFWADNGFTFKGVFDLEKDSISRMIFDKYISSRKIKIDIEKSEEERVLQYDIDESDIDIVTQFLQFSTDGDLDNIYQSVSEILKNSDAGSEEIKKDNDKGCLMFFPEIDIKTWKDSITNLLSQDIVLEYEFEPHITILYGFDDSKTDKERLMKLVESFVSKNPLDIQLLPLSYFRNDERDVLKVGIKDNNRNLEKLNNFIRINFPYENDYEFYSPHLTVAYIKSGEADKYKGNMFMDAGIENLSEGVFRYSDANKDKTTLYSNIVVSEDVVSDE